MRKNTCSFVVSFLFLGMLSIAWTIRAEEAPMFPFVISDGAPDNVVKEVSGWMEAPAGKNGFVRVQDGRFVDDKGRLLFWGTNLCFDACFPTREEAELLAARIARLGFNAVRLHHMDARDIWGGNKAKSLTTIDPVQMEKLDYLIAQFKKHGVYVNINLHVSRSFDDRDGFAGKEKRPKYDKGLDNFYPPFIELQKKYAKDLLTHVNPYTKTAYINEPAVCMVEINNENSIVRQWTGGNELAEMPDPYAAEYRRLWNTFLGKKYRTDAARRKAWGCREFPFGKDLFLSEKASNWRLGNSGGSQSTLVRENGRLRVQVEKRGKDPWIPQLLSGEFPIEKDKVYTVSFRMKADQKQSVSATVRLNHAPWTNLGFSSKVELDEQWKTFSYLFLASEGGKARFDVNGFAPGTYEIADLVLKPGGLLGTTREQTLDAGTVPVLQKSDTRFSKAAMDDFCTFLFDIERRYWIGMYRYLKDELKVRQPVSGTQLNYGSTVIQAELDYCDVHAYWGHPVFPGRPWDGKNWYISNRALVNHTPGSIFAHLATRRVHGKPYTVSEYDHPFPNQYGAEGLPMIAAFGRLQRWDGVFHFTYGNSSAKTYDRIAGYFNINANTVQLAHNPACHAIFARGDAAEGKNLLLADWSPGEELELFRKERSTTNFNFKGLGLDGRLALLHPTALNIVPDGTASSRKYPAIPETESRFRSETKQLFWDLSTEGKGFFLLDTPNTKVFTGFVEDGATHSFDGVTLRFGKTRLGWCTLSMVSVDGNGFGRNPDGKETRILVAATGDMTNTDMSLQQLDGNRVTLSNKWGGPPILCEGIPANITLEGIDAKRVRFYPLDEEGNRRTGRTAESVGNGLNSQIRISPEYKTVWYEIAVSP